MICTSNKLYAVAGGGSFRAIAALASIIASSRALKARVCSGQQGVLSRMCLAVSSTFDRIEL